VQVPHWVLTGFALWLAAEIVQGVNLEAGPDPLARIGTVLVVALLLCLVKALTRGVRRLAAALAFPLPVGLAVLVGLNAGAFWLTAALASAAGLGYTVDGLVPALVGSIVVLLVGWVGRPLVTDAPS
jgi:putative membrane protein